MSAPSPHDDHHTLDESHALHIDQVCGRFEKAWQAGSRPRLKDYLEEMAEPARSALLRELVLLDVDYRRLAGEDPQPAEYLGAFPSLDPEWLACAMARPAAPPSQRRKSAAAAPQVYRLRCPHCHNPIQLVDDRAGEVLCPGCGSSFRVRDARPTTTDSAMRPLGKFQLLQRVGLGAFGAVWKARDTQLDRIVALKIPHAGLLTADADLERFHREARAAAQLRHPGIVTVHEVQTLEGLPTIVSDFIEGVPLKDLLEVRPLSFREAATLLAEVAEAADYAHAMGLVHRDLKPANIMIEYGPGAADGGVGKPLVMDFGLALRDEAEITMTLDGQVLGTPAYMSPEQAAGKGHRADARSDVYSLGVILYQLLCNELPFRGSRLMIIHQVQREEPRPPRRLNDKIPRDLETICLKCLAKEPGKRYATARALADDLRCFLEGQPVQARRAGRVERTLRWARRRPALAALATVSVLAAGGLLSGWAWFTYQLDEARSQAEAHATSEQQQRELADEQKGLAEQRAEKLQVQKADLDSLTGLLDNKIKQLQDALGKVQEAERKTREEVERFAIVTGKAADFAWDAGNMEKARELLQEIPSDLRGWEWRYRQRHFQGCYLTLYGHTDWVTSVAFSPDGQRLASASGDGTVKLWDARTGAELRTLRGRTGRVTRVAFSPDGRRLASAGGDYNKPGEVMLWDAHTGAELVSLRGHTTGVLSVAFSPDGQRLASASTDRTVRLWDARTGAGPVTLRGHTSAVMSVAFSPDGQQLFSRDRSRNLLAWDTTTGVPVPQLRRPVLASAGRAARHPSRPILAFAQGNLIELVDLRPPDAVELGYRQGMARFDPHWQRQQARASMKAKNWFAALFHWGQLAEHDPSFVSCWEMEAACAGLGDWQSILAFYNELLRSDSTLAPVYYRRARIRAQLFQFHEATADNLMALVLRAHNPIGWPRFAEEADQEGDWHAQQRGWARAIEAFTDAALWERQPAHHRFKVAWAQLAGQQDTAFRLTLRDLYGQFRTMKDVELTYRLTVELGLGLSPGPSYLRGLGGPTAAVLLERMQLDRNPAIVHGACIVSNHGLPTGELVKLARQRVERNRQWENLENLGAAQYRAGQYADA